MKKISTLLVTLLVFKISFANTQEVNVSNNQFKPANFTINIGDTVKWIYVEGFHTTTSLNIPAGATPWDANLQTAGATFVYKVTVEGVYNYECKIHTPNMEGKFTVNGLTPVILSHFGVTSTKANTALISWITTLEQNTDHFEIMRSTNGVNFEKIGTVQANGNSSAAINYSYTDNALPGNYQYLYYYLTIVDKDGTKSLSSIALFKNINGTPKLIVLLSPNPISRPGHLILQFNSDKENSMHVQLFDASGKQVKQADLSASAGLNNGHFHIGDVPSGTYTIIFTMDAQKESYKIVVQ